MILLPGRLLPQDLVAACFLRSLPVAFGMKFA
jgi:hypothetical protein